MRAKGQNMKLSVLDAAGTPLVGIAVKSFEMTPQLEVQSEGYLGEDSDRRDDIYNGVTGSLELHFETQDVLTFMRSAIDRAKNKTNSVVFTISGQVELPNGQTPKIDIPDVRFGNMPLNFGSRTDYGTISLSFEAADYTYTPA